MDDIDRMIKTFVELMRKRVIHIRGEIAKWDIRPIPDNYRRNQ
jgi:hypothetical protein